MNDVLGKIKDKISKFKSFILFKGLDNDFKEYELKQEQELKQKMESEKDFLSLEVEHRSSHSYFNR